MTSWMVNSSGKWSEVKNLGALFRRAAPRGWSRFYNDPIKAVTLLPLPDSAWEFLLTVTFESGALYLSNYASWDVFWQFKRTATAYKLFEYGAPYILDYTGRGPIYVDHLEKRFP